MSNNTIPQLVCTVIPPHMLERVARYQTVEASANARATLEHMHELAAGRVQTLIDCLPEPAPDERSEDRQHVYDAGHRHELPGRLVEVTEAWDGCGATDNFFERVLRRRSIDGRGMRLDSTVHYGRGFENAMWNGRQMVYGDGDGRVFKRFTASLEVIAHELTHGVTQYTAALGYTGQTGALNEHISDAFGIMVKQYTLGQSADQSDWLIGSQLFGPAVHGCAVRSLAFPGTAYDDPILGRDPQPSHMDGYVRTAGDNGGVHINSGILNHAFYLAAMEIGGYTWEVLGKIWYAALTQRLRPDANFADFARATVAIAGERFGRGGRIQRAVAEAWADVGVSNPDPYCPESHDRGHKRRTRMAADAAARRRAQWRRQLAERRSSTHQKKERRKIQ
jgi:Zn-dependent metalloprotease